MNKWRFSQVEQRLEQFIEGGFARLFAGRLSPRDVATRLARAMYDGAIMEADGGALSPNAFTVHLNSEDYQALLEAQPELAQLLSDSVLDLAHQTDMRLLSAPTVTLVPGDDVPQHTITVQAEHQKLPAQATQAFSPIDATAIPPQTQPRNAQLIVNGTHYVPLNRQVINIGRRFDNHVVVEDARVSRTHAQLRLRFGRFVLYDLGSSGGTFVNDQRITEIMLKPGDVISLGGALLVYIEDETPSADNKLSKTDTQLRRSRPLSQESDASAS